MSSSTDADALYALLPAFVRMRDQTQGGGVLQALVGIIAEQAQVVSASLDQLYTTSSSRRAPCGWSRTSAT